MIYLVLVFASFNLFAAKQEHKAHAHGAGKMSIAFEAAKGQLTLEAPGESIYGFEHVAKTAAHKKKQAEALTKLETGVAEMVVFEKQLNCNFTKQKLEISQDGNHAEVQAAFVIQCEKDPVGSTIRFHVQSVFPKLKNVDVQVLAGDVQKAVKATKNGVQVELKK